MLKISIQTLCFLALLTGISVAACPTSVPGTAIDAIKANEARILCLQAEIEAASNQRQLNLELTTQRTAIQTLQLQRRFDNLPKFELPKFEMVRP